MSKKITEELPVYFREYLDEKFRFVSDEMSVIKQDIANVKTEIKKNGDCLSDCKGLLENQGSRIRHLFVGLGIAFLLIVLGTISGIELITKGILAFIR